MAKMPATQTKATTKISEADQLNKVQPLEILALLSAGFFVHSVATDAQKALNIFRFGDFKLGGFNLEVRTPRDLELSGIVLLIFTLVIVTYYFAKRKTLSHIAIASLMLIAGSFYVWLFGLKVNL